MNVADKLEYLINQIKLLVENAMQLREQFSVQLSQVHPDYKTSAVNLVDYLALRQFDMRELQEELSQLGMSSLGRCEAHVLASLHQVLKLLHSLLQKELPEESTDDWLSFHQSKKLLTQATEKLLNEKPASREVRIMVTLPDEAAENYDLVHNMMLAGMDAARINCSHGNEIIWTHIIQNVKKAASQLNKKCAIMMDLSGPKLRTGKLSNRLQILKLSPKKNQFGQILQSAEIWLLPSGEKSENQTVSSSYIQMDISWLQKIQTNDTILFKDKRGKLRKLKIIAQTQESFQANCDSTAYIDTTTVFKIKGKKNHHTSPQGIFGQAQPLLLKMGEILELHKKEILGENAQIDEVGNVISFAKISCQMPEIFDLAKEGEPVKLNDGKIEGIIQQITPETIRIKITLASENGSSLNEEKGINFPETNITLPRLTDKDLKDLDFICQNADLLALSFVHTSEDVQNLIQEIQKRKAHHLGIILKIETQNGFNNLPWLLLTGMQHFSLGVMIARGDLAVECGWVRLAEVQEEILWLCEAAHIPVVWATQVLENLAQKGIPSRAEITDAAMSQRAECVMLNKGPYILKAIETLNEILNKMQNHQLKKSAQLRKLAVTEMKKD